MLVTVIMHCLHLLSNNEGLLIFLLNILFLPHDAVIVMPSLCLCVCVCMCVSVFLSVSHFGIVSKWLNIG